nr:MAG TPA: hypothetical protein [Caudoviricetes sp.]
MVAVHQSIITTMRETTSLRLFCRSCFLIFRH